MRLSAVAFLGWLCLWVAGAVTPAFAQAEPPTAQVASLAMPPSPPLSPSQAIIAASPTSHPRPRILPASHDPRRPAIVILPASASRVLHLTMQARIDR